MKRQHIIYLVSIVAILCLGIICAKYLRPKKYSEVSFITNKIGEGRNDVQGIILHHTGEEEIPLDKLLFFLSYNKLEISTHLLIGKDGTRYVLAAPEAITWHAGYSILNGREKCNDFTVGIEFYGNTQEQPLTKDQIYSAIEYILPLMKKYNIPKENIVTHEMVRRNWLDKYPHRAVEKQVEDKVDITQEEYIRFMKILESKM